MDILILALIITSTLILKYKLLDKLLDNSKFLLICTFFSIE